MGNSPLTPNLEFPDMSVNIRSPITDYVDATSAYEACRQLEKVFNQFMARLKPDEEVGLALTSFGIARQIIVVSVNAIGQNQLMITGIENDQEVVLVQHISQMNFLLIPVKTVSPEQTPRRKIGFSSE